MLEVFASEPMLYSPCCIIHFNIFQLTSYFCTYFIKSQIMHVSNWIYISCQSWVGSNSLFNESSLLSYFTSISLNSIQFLIEPLKADWLSLQFFACLIQGHISVTLASSPIRSLQIFIQPVGHNKIVSIEMIPLFPIKVFPPFEDSYSPWTSLNTVKGTLGFRDIRYWNLWLTPVRWPDWTASIAQALVFYIWINSQIINVPNCANFIILHWIKVWWINTKLHLVLVYLFMIKISCNWAALHLRNTS